MATQFKELYNSVCSKIKDYDFIKMDEDDVFSILHDYLRPAIVAFECCNQDLSDRNEERESFNFDLSDTNFEILSNFIVIFYLDSTYIKNPLALQAHMSTSDFHKYDNKDVLAKVIEVRNIFASENKQLMINYSLRGDSEYKRVFKKIGRYSPRKKVIL